MRSHFNIWNPLYVLALATALYGCPGQKTEEPARPTSVAQSEMLSGDAESTTQDAGENVSDASSEQHEEVDQDEAQAGADATPPREDTSDTDEFVRPARRSDDDGDSLPFETRVKLAAEPIPAPFIADLMTRQDIRRNFGYDGPLHETGLPGRRSSPTYQSLRFATEDEFGFAVELIKTDNRTDVIRLVRDLRSSWLESSGEPRLGYGASGESLGIRSMVIGSVSTSFIAILSCSEELCAKDQLLAMMLETKNRLESGESR